MCPHFAHVLAVRIVPALRLRRRGDDDKTNEILLLRHQPTVSQRQLAAAEKRPRPDWADRAIIALLVGLVPRARRAGLCLFVAPDTILRRHRDLLRLRWAKKSQSKNGRPATHRNIKSLVLRMARQNPEWGCRWIHGPSGLTCTNEVFGKGGSVGALMCARVSGRLRGAFIRVLQSVHHCPAGVVIPNHLDHPRTEQLPQHLVPPRAESVQIGPDRHRGGIVCLQPRGDELGR